MEWTPQRQARPALPVEDVAAAGAKLEAKGVELLGETFEAGICHTAFFRDADGNDLVLRPRVGAL